MQTSQCYLTVLQELRRFMPAKVYRIIFNNVPDSLVMLSGEL